jgi:hypothetical protein
MLLGRQRCCSQAYPKALVQLASKLTESAKYCYLDCVTGFVTLDPAQTSAVSRHFRRVPKRIVCDTVYRLCHLANVWTAQWQMDPTPIAYHQRISGQPNYHDVATRQDEP